MKVSQLAALLDHLARGLEPVVAAAVPADLHALAAAMAPFADRTVADFTTFVGRCEEYQRTGVVPGTGGGRAGGGGRAPAAKKAAADPDRVAKAVAGVRAAFDEIDRGTVDAARIEQVLQPLNALPKPDLDAALTQLGFAGKSKSKADALGKVRQRLTNQAEAGTRVQTMREDR